MDKIIELLHELRCDINYCKIDKQNDAEIENAQKTLNKLNDLLSIDDKSAKILNNKVNDVELSILEHGFEFYMAMKNP